MEPLYEITARYKAALNDLQDLDLPEEAIADTLEGLQGEIQEKSINVAMFIGNVEAMALAREDAAKQMMQRAKAEKTRADKLKQYLLENMERSGISKIECPYFTLTVKKCPPSVALDSDAVIGEEYLSHQKPAPPRAPDKAKIKSALKSGVSITGASLIQNNRLEIK